MGFVYIFVKKFDVEKETHKQNFSQVVKSRVQNTMYIYVE